VGQKVKLGIIRDGKPIALEVTTSSMPDKPEAAKDKDKEIEETLGAKVQELTPSLLPVTGCPGSSRGS